VSLDNFSDISSRIFGSRTQYPFDGKMEVAKSAVNGKVKLGRIPAFVSSIDDVILY
jgi:hypothetical protein